MCNKYIEQSRFFTQLSFGELFEKIKIKLFQEVGSRTKEFNESWATLTTEGDYLHKLNTNSNLQNSLSTSFLWILSSSYRIVNTHLTNERKMGWINIRYMEKKNSIKPIKTRLS